MPSPVHTQTRCPRWMQHSRHWNPDSHPTPMPSRSVEIFRKFKPSYWTLLPPLLELLELTEMEDSEGLLREPRDIILDTISLLGNAVTQTSKIRRKRILKACNQDIQDLADEDDIFKEAAPNLFGQDFEKKWKIRLSQWNSYQKPTPGWYQAVFSWGPPLSSPEKLWHLLQGRQSAVHPRVSIPRSEHLLTKRSKFSK